MSTDSFAFQLARKAFGVVAAGLLSLGGLTTANAEAAHSSPEDRARFVSTTRQLEQSPLNPSLQQDREWALQWLTQAPDVAVTVCLDSLGRMGTYQYAPEVVLQYTFSMAAFVIQHPETAKEADAQQLAGADGALNAYEAILTGKPNAKTPALDSLLTTRRQGKLPAFIRKASARCRAKG